MFANLSRPRISWVGSIYQKFEAICHEVDFVSQDKIKYVENQVHTVGESVKQACSNVVQDLLSSSSVDSEENKAQALSPVKSIDNATEIKLTAKERLYLGVVEKLCADAILNPDLKSVEELSLPHISGTTEIIESVAENNCKSGEASLTTCVHERSSESTKEESSMEMLSSSHTSEMIDTVKSEGTGAFCRFVNLFKAFLKLWLGWISSDDSCSLLELASIVDARGDILCTLSAVFWRLAKTVELNDEVKLDERCVVVDSYALALSRRGRNPRSYQDAFASKRRLAKEYEQLAIWYGDIDAEFSQQRVKKPSSYFPVNSSSKNDPNDSDWELLIHNTPNLFNVVI
ncbi:hypothetical protein RJ641_034337 [Dillenia turbinata]|uniref:Uncharacterized protein n=1 Tax=Dillenia turbinata TaxID=194707 RepID=A0AAN8VVG9_9MAGN